VWAIQDRINMVVLHRIVISNQQAYKQRWVIGAPEPVAGPSAGKPPWDPGADMIWLSTDPNTKFGEFGEADIKQVLEEIRDDVGDLAAISQTPATFLVNRMVNVSGDALTEVSAGHAAKVRLHQDAVGFFFERLMRLAFLYTGNSKASEVAQVVWWPIDSRSQLAGPADAFQKFIASGVPLEIAMEMIGIFTDEQIQYAVQKQEEERARAEQAQKEAQQQKEAQGNGGLQRGAASAASQQGSSPA
jgi:hypothetical protein